MSLLRKDSFIWTTIARETFEQLKKVVTKGPALTLPDFVETLVVECDASTNGLGAVLMQKGQPLVYLSKALHEKKSVVVYLQKRSIGLSVVYAKVAEISDWSLLLKYHCTF